MSRLYDVGRLVRAQLSMVILIILIVFGADRSFISFVYIDQRKCV